MSKYKAWADKIQMFRFHDSFHLGLGDIRLSRGDGDDLMRDLMEADALEARVAELLVECKAANAQLERAAHCIEHGRYDEALLHCCSMSRPRRAAIAKAEGEHERA